MLDADESDRIGRDDADQLRDRQVAPPQGPHDRLCSRRLRIGSDQRRAHELAQMCPEPLLDEALHQHENPDRDEEARPGAEIEQERPGRGGADRVPRKSAQHQRHAPGDADQERCAPAGVQRPFVQQTEALLQVIERSAVRDQEFIELA